MAGRIDTDLIVKAVSEGFEDLQGDLKATSEDTKLLDKSVAGLAKAAAGVAAGLFAADKLKEFGKEAINAASAAQETTSLLENSLGPAARQFGADMQEVADATGRSRFQLEAGASTLVAMARNMGMARQESADFSVQMTQAAVDLGSFFNRAESDVLRDLQGALGGSSETMQKYGIDVRETTLKQKAYEQGLIETGETLDRATRAQLILSETMRQASDAMGDAERTADSYENTMRSLGAELHDFKVNVGEALLDSSTGAAGAMANLVGWINENAEATNTLRRAEELGLISKLQLERMARLRTEAELDNVEAAVAAREEVLARAAAEDDLRAAMSKGTSEISDREAEIARYAEVAAEARSQIMSLTDEVLASAFGEQGGGERTLRLNVEADLDIPPHLLEWMTGGGEMTREIRVAFSTAEGGGRQDPLEVIFGELNKNQIRQNFEDNVPSAEEFQEVLMGKIGTRIDQFEIPVEMGEIDTTTVISLQEKLGVASDDAVGVQQNVMAIDDTPVRDLMSRSEDAHDELNSIVDDAPYSVEMEDNLDPLHNSLVNVKNLIDTISGTHHIRFTQSGSAGVSAGASGGGQGGPQAPGQPIRNTASDTIRLMQDRGMVSPTLLR